VVVAGEVRAAPVVVADEVRAAPVVVAGEVRAAPVVDVDQVATAEDADRDEKKKIQASSSASSKFDVYRRSSRAAETSHLTQWSLLATATAMLVQLSGKPVRFQMPFAKERRTPRKR
jgi:hypothetical protein